MLRPLPLLIASFLAFALSHVSSAQQTTGKVRAKRGDGVTILLQRHGLNPVRDYNRFVALNRASLGPRNSLIAGKYYRLPTKQAATVAKKKPTATKTVATAARTTSTKVKTPLSNKQLFGPRYGQVSPRSKQLSGTVYYLLSGHGGPDPGAVGKYGSYQLAEDEYAYDITARLAKVLMEHGAKVHVIVQDPNDGIRDEAVLRMDNDEITTPNLVIPLNHVARLRQYTNAINRLHGRYKGAYQRMITLHIDSRSAGLNTDVFFYHHDKSPVGKRLANNIHKVFTARYKRSQPNRPYVGTVSPRSSLYVVRNSHAPTVFIELGNIRNDKDQRRFVIPDNRQALANWICEGLITDYRNRK
ncbi:N-acetylmuramoyl-L-alanine amidase family protein [Solirubrum puertoriconensis]|uniref:N-acetylmuramoyl-L-alanine amidase family protein n=1 Tax=Solirubrum puertoriconensis TaxID=1751427 RepID=UPI0025707812|nr:N-acetylmuramoyl-L-alanine amidase [Solirubrum puertoriconensis]